MRRVRSKRLLKDESGATAAVFGLSLFALVAIGGLGFDYARLAGMDSELQNAADQAALAGASQLDGKVGTCMRASAAASTLVANMTLLANDGDGTAVTLAPEPDCDADGNIRFWQDKGKTQAADDDSNAHFIEVEIGARTANYAFTPLAGAMRGDLGALAFAGVGSAICKVPPVMMCNPAEATDPDFTVDNYIGDGMLLIADGGYAPGNFGFLASNISDPVNDKADQGAQALAEAMGREAPPGNCISIDGVTTEPGAMSKVRDALNTRFDVYANGLNNACGKDGEYCPPAYNTRKDLVRGNGNGKCNGNTWVQPASGARYLPSSGYLSAADRAKLAPMGFPRDICHAVSPMNCGGRIGDGDWDRAAYFESNKATYGAGFSPLATFGTDTPKRYDVYKWEVEQQLEAGGLQPLDRQAAGNGNFSDGTPSCSPPGIVGSETVPDRRVLSVAVINCGAEGLSGRKSGVHVTQWIDMFLVEPSFARDRTSDKDVYGEIIGETRLGGGGGTTDNTVRRDIPYLIE
ncbi:pilus assembly protein [Sphingopyxis indica]|uniref:pilus assembly protein TadG-related protein n=1 Tax=Sphingopyxis indica TaxID=436663 RepID=UPI002939215E|nr:pilus assembly protein TadG-related protein [Sphingopyxis indica]WOF43821.1 pilus assembly protein [Sphingopyxis indica]